MSYLFEAVGQCIVMSLSSSSDEKLLYLSNMEYRNDWSGNFTQEPEADGKCAVSVCRTVFIA